jgi:hypothetical protein
LIDVIGNGLLVSGETSNPFNVIDRAHALPRAPQHARSTYLLPEHDTMTSAQTARNEAHHAARNAQHTSDYQPAHAFVAHQFDARACDDESLTSDYFDTFSVSIESIDL